jgi:hypothetical protein
MTGAGKITRGRKPGEVAVVFSPRLPTARMTADLVARLARALVAEPRAAAPAPAPAKPPAPSKPRERARRAA